MCTLVILVCQCCIAPAFPQPRAVLKEVLRAHVVTLNEQEIASGAFVAGIHAAIPDQIPDAILHA
jgi:hypothetical protein